MYNSREDSIITVTKEFSFDCAHMLTGHEGLCRNLHGHTYKFQVEVFTFGGVFLRGPSQGMIVDFKDLKSVVNELIVDKFDHSCIIWENGNDTEVELGNFLINHDLKCTFVPYRPTAENMALAFYDTLNAGIKNVFSGARIKSIRVWETPTSVAEVRCNR